MSRLLFGSLLLAYGTAALSTPVTDNLQPDSKGYYPGMLIVKGEYVRLQNCTQRQDYTLLPAGKYGYETMAELISVRKNMPDNIPISVGLQGEVEYDESLNATGNFLVRGLEFIKQGENCNIVATPIAKMDADTIEATSTDKDTDFAPPHQSENNLPIPGKPAIAEEIAAPPASEMAVEPTQHAQAPTALEETQPSTIPTVVTQEAPPDNPQLTTPVSQMENATIVDTEQSDKTNQTAESDHQKEPLPATSSSNHIPTDTIITEEIISVKTYFKED